MYGGHFSSACACWLWEGARAWPRSWWTRPFVAARPLLSPRGAAAGLFVSQQRPHDTPQKGPWEVEAASHKQAVPNREWGAVVRAEV